MHKIMKKLVLVLVTFLSITRTKKENKILVKISHIYYLILSKKYIITT